MIDLRRLDAIMGQLAPEDAEWLSEQLEPAWHQRARRLEARDVMVVVAAGDLGEVAPVLQARALERALARYLASSWHTERHTGPAPHNLALHRLATLNEGRGLGWRRIVDILALNPVVPLQ